MDKSEELTQTQLARMTSLERLDYWSSVIEYQEGRQVYYRKWIVFFSTAIVGIVVLNLLRIVL